MSKAILDKLPKEPDENKIHLYGYEIPVHESPLFPFEIHYDACDIETRELIKVGSGVMIQGCLVPSSLEDNSMPFDWHPNFPNPIKSRMEVIWATEIFKYPKYI